MGKLPTRSNEKVYVLVLTDYFTKWVEDEAFSQTRDEEVMGFIWKHIRCRFDLPKNIITENGSQFISFKFQDFC